MADLFSPPEEMEFRIADGAGGAVCSEVLEHVDDPTAFLRAASSIRSANAIILITVPGGRMSAFDRHIGHRRHFNGESLHEILVLRPGIGWKTFTLRLFCFSISIGWP